MELLILLLVLGLLSGAVLGWVSFIRLKSLENRVRDLQRSIAAVAEQLDKRGDPSTDSSIVSRQASISPAKILQDMPAIEAPANPSSEEANLGAAQENVWTGDSEPDGKDASTAPSPPLVPAVAQGFPNSLFDRLRDQWMIWLGGISIGLAGIFMVRYSIEQGLLGPTARVSLSIAAGFFLHAVAEFSRRRYTENYSAIAALAGGASIILYSAFLAALNLYDLLPSGVVFAALIGVSLCTMALAVIHGPVLAILGVLGAYVLPALIDTGSENILNLFAYSLIITAASLILMRYVYRPWLWSGMLTGSLGWWLLTLGSQGAEGLRGFYLAALLYLFLAIPSWDWQLRKPNVDAAPDPDKSTDEFGLGMESLKLKFAAIQFPKNNSEAPGLLSTSLLIIAFGLSIAAEQRVSSAIVQWTPFVGILLIAGGSKPELIKLAAASLLIQLLAWLTLGLTNYDGLRLEGLIGPGQYDFMVYAGWMAFVYSSLSLRNLRTSPKRDLCFALAVASPLLWLSVSYLLLTDLSESIAWGSLAVALGVVYFAFAAWRFKLEKTEPSAAGKQTKYFAVWLILGGHFAYSLAVAIMIREAGLTLALAAQIFTITWLIHRFDPPRLDWLLKLVLAVVVIRLTANPWLLTYSSDIHWSLWTYGGSTLFAAASAWWLRKNEALGRWLELATLHLLVLTLWAETRYYIYDGDIFRQQFDLLEFSINTALWSSLALVYYLRHQASQHLKVVYLFVSKVLLALGLVSYTMVLVPLNPFWSSGEISSTPILNLLLLSFGFPVVISVLLYRYYAATLRKWIGQFMALSAFVFINAEIRHLWTGDFSVMSQTTSGELYTYSAVWLLLSIACLLAGSIRYGKTVYQGGFGLMMLVIGKIFLIDMADLEGLLRVATFMGLGVSLLGLAFLYQRFNLKVGDTDKIIS